MEADLRIAFVGTYPPRRCGIATFTRDLADAIKPVDERMLPMTLAVTESGGQYEYPGDVKYEIRQGVKGDYARAAEFVNYSDVRLVSVQHEHGIFGGDDGAYILDFVTALRVPVIATLHTVLKDPSESQRAIVQGMTKHAGNARITVSMPLLGPSNPKVRSIRWPDTPNFAFSRLCRNRRDEQGRRGTARQLVWRARPQGSRYPHGIPEMEPRDQQ